MVEPNDLSSDRRSSPITPNPTGKPPRRLTSLFPDHPILESSRAGEARIVLGEPDPLEARVDFDFAQYAWVLAELALNQRNETPFTVVVKGEWGRGKTTLLRQTKGHLDKHGDVKSPEEGYRRVKTLWFNAWKYPQTDCVLAGLLGAMLDQLRSKENGLVDWAKFHVKDKKASAAALLLRKIFPETFGESGEMQGKYSALDQRRAFYDHFRQSFHELTHLWFDPAWKAFLPGKEAPLDDRAQAVAVFLDDLDRCSDERIADTLEAITLFLDFPGVCFYLGLDWTRLVVVLRRRFDNRAEHYLEKMFQIAVDLPEVAPHRAEGYIKRLIQGTSVEPILRDREGAIATVLRSRDPRHVKRFLNDLSIRLALLERTGQLEVADAGEEGGAESQGGAAGAAGRKGGMGVRREAADRSARVSAEAVLAWHLLHEQVSSEDWRVAMEDLGNTQGMLNKHLKLFSEAAEKARSEPGSDAGVESSETAQARILVPFMEQLAALAKEQKSILVHLASPVRPEAALSSARAFVGLRPDADILDPDLWVTLPAGEFLMGSDDPRDNEAAPMHEVELDAFKILRYPVTNAQYEKYVLATKAEAPQHWPQGRIPEGKGQHPVVNVSWNNAEAFCTWLTERLGPEKKERILLPTEAQWEYAARGTGGEGVKGRTYPWGSKPEPSKELANYGMQVGGTTPVDAYPKGATPERVFDLAGNVWEWCRDGFGPYPQERQENPVGPTSAPARVLRGGAFLFDPGYLRAAFRSSYDPGFRDVGFGFRCVWCAAGGL